MLMRPSARASGPPGHEWAPRPNAMWSNVFARSTRNSAGHSKRRGSRFAAPLSSITGVPASMRTPPTFGGPAGETEVGLHRALDAQRLLDEVGDAVAVLAQLVLELRVLGEVLQGSGEEAGCRLLARGEEEGRDAHDRGDVGRRPVRVLGECEVGDDVGARLAAAVLDVGGEPVVEPREGVELLRRLLVAEPPGRAAVQAEALPEPLVVGLGHPEEVGDRQHGERLRVGADELAATVGDELVELLIGETPHERLVLLQPLRRDEAHQQAPLARVLGRVHGDEVLVHRELVAVAFDDVAHVVAFQRHGEDGEGPDDGVARREDLAVAVDLEGLVIARHGDDAVVRERRHRALRPQVLEVRVRILHRRVVREEVDLVQLGCHGAPFTSSGISPRRRGWHRRA